MSTPNSQDLYEKFKEYIIEQYAEYSKFLEIIHSMRANLIKAFVKNSIKDFKQAKALPNLNEDQLFARIVADLPEADQQRVAEAPHAAEKARIAEARHAAEKARAADLNRKEAQQIENKKLLDEEKSLDEERNKQNQIIMELNSKENINPDIVAFFKSVDIAEGALKAGLSNYEDFYDDVVGRNNLKKLIEAGDYEKAITDIYTVANKNLPKPTTKISGIFSIILGGIRIPSESEKTLDALVKSLEFRIKQSSSQEAKPSAPKPKPS